MEGVNCFAWRAVHRPVHPKPHSSSRCTSQSCGRLRSGTWATPIMSRPNTVLWRTESSSSAVLWSWVCSCNSSGVTCVQSQTAAAANSSDGCAPYAEGAMKPQQKFQVGVLVFFTGLVLKV